MSTLPSASIPTSKDVLLIESFSAMGGEGLTCNCAFVFNRLRGGGIIIDSAGRMCDVDAADWRKLQHIVADARDTIIKGGGGSWSRPTGEPRLRSGDVFCVLTCAMYIQGTSALITYYDLGPAEEAAGIEMVRFSGHTVRWGGPRYFEHTNAGVYERVMEMPSSLVEVVPLSTTIFRTNLHLPQFPTVSGRAQGNNDYRKPEPPPPRAWIHSSWYTDPTLPESWSTDWEEWVNLDLFEKTINGKLKIEKLFNDAYGVPGTIEPIAYSVETSGEVFLFTAGGRYYFYSEYTGLAVHHMEFASPKDFLAYFLESDEEHMPAVPVPKRPGADLSWW
ncbi:hypothetical protein FB451DRAFT_1405954 [Mycena latifolia]|nr:hypothetical protein FB451DRAFT_1405954 [Mycena latifolia]